MAPFRAGSELALSQKLIGRLIGKGGTTIQELEKQTNCRIRIPRESSADHRDQEALCIISVCCNSARNCEDADVREACCVRAAHLLCNEGLGLTKALEQADAERKAAEDQEATIAENEQVMLAVGRIQCWHNFDEADIRAALCEACDDEDAAVDLLLTGYRAPQPVEPVLPQVKAKEAVVVEAFPALPSHQQESNVSCCLQSSNSWRNSWDRRKKAASRSPEDEFPSLPEPLEAPRSAIAPKISCRGRPYMRKLLLTQNGPRHRTNR
eukprot:TRINITY_DN111116_c0_g1_i1.p1 TRINITY_DN111116_c0_g1~~TRINITY_DN111116_c0_g1_i1.p1  ORF type:complete len:267 (+),score=60.99 TRINITY_DN111116_c0_g1_i1:77-877(+)